jgi:iron complex outermembrane receptor protein
VVPLFFESNAHARTYGGEVFANWHVTNRWKISPGYSLIHLNLDPNAASQDANPGAPAANTPRNQFTIRSLLNLPRNIEWDNSFSYVGGLRDSGEGAISGYRRLDTRLAKRLGESIEFSIVGQNLLAPRHAEFHDGYGVFHSLVARKVFAQITWHL